MASALCPSSSFVLRAVVAAIALAGLSTGASAQKADIQQSSKRGDVLSVLRNQAFGNDRRVFEDYFNKYFLLQFVDPSGVYSFEELPKVRQHLRIFFNTGKNGPPHARLNELTLAKMKEFIEKGKFGENDAAVKYNALLTIGELNEDESEPRKPYAEAADYLLQVLRDEKYSDYLNAAALIGLERMAFYGGTTKLKSPEATKILLGVLTEEAPAGRSASVQNYLRRRAAQTLANLGSPGPDNSVLKGIEAVAVDPQARPTLRADMAACLGQLKLTNPAAKAQAARIAAAVQRQAVDMCRHEVDRAEIENRDPSRQLLLHVLNNAARGSADLLKASPDQDAKKSLSAAGSKIFALFRKLSDLQGTPDDQIAEAVTGSLSEIESLLPKPADAKSGPLAAANGKAKPEKPAAKSN